MILNTSIKTVLLPAINNTKSIKKLMINLSAIDVSIVNQERHAAIQDGCTSFQHICVQPGEKIIYIKLFSFTKSNFYDERVRQYTVITENNELNETLQVPDSKYKFSYPIVLVFRKSKL